MSTKPKSRVFSDVVDTLDYLEVCRITVTPNGAFEVPSERDGRIAQITVPTRKALAKFCRSFADRLESKASKPRRK